MKNTELKNDTKSRFFITFFSGLYTLIYFISLIGKDVIKVNGEAFPVNEYRLYVFYIPFILAAFLMSGLFLINKKEIVGYFIRKYSVIVTVLICISPVFLIYSALSSPNPDVFSRMFLSFFFLFCLPVTIISLCFCNLVTLMMTFHKQNKIYVPNLTFSKVYWPIVISMLCGIIFLGFSFVKIGMVFFLISLSLLYILDFHKHKINPQKCILLFFLYMIFYPAFLFYFFGNQILLTFIFY